MVFLVVFGVVEACILIFASGAVLDMVRQMRLSDPSVKVSRL